MKIVLVTDYFRPGNSRVQENHLEGFANRGHDVHLIAGHEHPEGLREQLDERVSAHPYDYDPHNSKLPELWSVRRGIHRAWNEVTAEIDPDLLLFNQPLSAWFIQGVARTQTTQFYVHHAPWHEEWQAHNPPPDGGLTSRMVAPFRWFNRTVRRRIENTVLQQCQQIFVLSDFMRNKVTQNHPMIDPGRITNIPGGIDPDQFHPPENRNHVKNKFNLEGDRKVVLSVRRLVPRMGLDRLIKSFGHFLNRGDHSGVILIIVGEGPEEEHLKRLANEHAPGQVRFPGYVSEDTLPEYYQLADLFVLPTRELEGFGLVTVEALASGCPVLATPVGGTKEILEPFDDSCLLPPYDPAEWAEAIHTRLVSPPPDETYRRACRDYVIDHFSWQEGINAILNTYGSIEENVRRNESTH